MKKEVLQEEVEQLISQSFWGKSGIPLKENTEVVANDEVEQQPEVVDSEEEVVNEETHTCPLCESQLESEISDDKLTEHIEMLLGIINEMNDITDEELESIEEEIDQDDEEGDEEVVEEAKDMQKLKSGSKLPAKATAKAKTSVKGPKMGC